MGDEDPLLLAAGEATDSGLGEGMGVHCLEHLLGPLAPRLRMKGKAESVTVHTELDQVSRASGGRDRGATFWGT